MIDETKKQEEINEEESEDKDLDIQLEEQIESLKEFKEWLEITDDDGVSNFDKLQELDTIPNIRELINIVEWFNLKLDTNKTNLQSIQELDNLSKILKWTHWLNYTDEHGQSGADKVNTLRQLNIYDFKELLKQLEQKETKFQAEFNEQINIQSQNIQEKLEELQSNYDSAMEDFETKQSTVTKYLSAVQSSLENSYQKSREITTIYTTNDTKLKKCHDEWETLKTEYSEKTQEQQKSHESHLLLIRKELREYCSALDDIRQEASAILDLSTSAGLARSYQDKIERISKEIKNQRIIFTTVNMLISGIAIYGFSNLNITSYININTVYEILLRSIPTLAMISPLLWIAKQNGDLLRQNILLREEYEHKKSLVSTYNGYKDSLLQTVDDEKHLHDEEKHPIFTLVEDTTKGIMKNPSDKVHLKQETMPYEDLIKLLVKKVPSDKIDISSIVQSLTSSSKDSD